MSVKISSLNTASTINSGDDINIAGNNPLAFSDWGGGWFMQDSVWIRSYNNKSLWMNVGNIGADGCLTIGYGGAATSAGGAIIAGSVGIGTSSPTILSGYNTLTLDGTTGTFTEYRQNGTALFRVGADASRPFFYGMTNANMDFYTNTALRMTIAAGGNVGINTTSPASAAKLHIVADSSTSSIFLDAYGARAGFLGRVASGTIASPGYITLNYNMGAFGVRPWNGTDFYSGGNTYISFVASEAHALNALGGRIVFQTTLNGTVAGVERMRIENSGNVLIGTTTDSGYKLDVNGSISWGTAAGSYMYAGGSSHLFAFSASNGNYLYSGGAQGLTINNAADTLNLVKFADNGNVLIGTNTDLGYKLTIAGNSNSYSVSPHAAGIDIYSTGNIAPHYQTTYTWYTGLIGAGTFRMGLDASGNLTAGSFIGAGTGLTGTASALSIGGSAGSVAWANISGIPNEIFNYDGWVTNPGYDANTIAGNKSGFTYANNAPYVGTLTHFAASGYGLQFNASYSGGGTGIGYRTRNGDTATWNSWFTIITSSNIGSQSVAYAANAGTLGTYAETSFVRLAANSSSPTNGNFAMGQSSSRNFIQSHAGQPLDLNPLGNAVTINGYVPLTDNNISSYAVKTLATITGNIDSDYGECFVTFDPIPSGTPPLSSPNIRTINVGNSYSRRTQLAFDYASDTAFFRRRTEAGWFAWREFIHSGNIGSQSVNYSTTAGSTTLLVSPNGATVVAADSAMPSQGQSFIHTLALGPGADDGHILGMTWANTTTIYGAQIWLDTDPSKRMAIRNRSNSGTWTSWAEVLTDSNYNSYSPTLTGGGASGTWGINVTGISDLTAGIQAYFLGTNSVNVNTATTSVFRNENGAGAVLSYAPVLHVAASDTMWQLQGTYGTTGNGTLYFRQGYNGSWGTWLTMISSANISSYLSGVYLPLTGGTLTGTLNGTRAVFSTAINNDYGLSVTNTGTTGAGGLYVNIGTSATGAPIRVDKAGVNIFLMSSTGNITMAGDLAVDGGDIIISSSGGANVFTRYQNGTGNVEWRLAASVFTLVDNVNEISLMEINPTTAGTFLYYPSLTINTSNTSGGVLLFKATLAANTWGIYKNDTTGLTITKNSVTQLGISATGAITLINTLSVTGGYIEVGQYGLSSSTYSAYIRRNDISSYGAWDITGGKGGYTGALYNTTNLPHIMFGTTNGFGGLYYQTGSRWVLYYNYTDNCLAVGGTTTNATYKMYVTGAIYATGAIVANSDGRNKENVEVVENALEKVTNLRGVTYTKKDQDSGKREMGVIAQEVEPHVPEVVHHSKDADIYGVSYGNFAGLFIEAIKEQQVLINELQAKIEILEKNK